MGAECIAVSPTHVLRSVKREYRSRKKGCYVLQDKYGEYLIVAQKLNVIASFLNSVAVDRGFSYVKGDFYFYF